MLTIGTFGAATEPTVSIDGVTITGGVTTSSPESVPFVGKPNVYAAGGGIEIPPADGFQPGASVTITNSAIVGNRVHPDGHRRRSALRARPDRAHTPAQPAAGSTPGVPWPSQTASSPVTQQRASRATRSEVRSRATSPRS